MIWPEHQKTVVTLTPEPKGSQPLLPSIQDITSMEPGASTSSLLPPLAPFQTRPPGPLHFGMICSQCQCINPLIFYFYRFPRLMHRWRDR